MLWDAGTMHLTPFSSVLSELLASSQAPCIRLRQALLSRVSDVTADRYIKVLLQFCSAAEDAELSLGALTSAAIVDLLFTLRADSKVHASNPEGLPLQLPWPLHSPLFQVSTPIEVLLAARAFRCLSPSFAFWNEPFGILLMVLLIGLFVVPFCL